MKIPVIVKTTNGFEHRFIDMEERSMKRRYDPGQKRAQFRRGLRRADWREQREEMR